MKRRLSRAKAKIKATGIPFAVPDAHLLPDRLDAVLAVLYLIYNEGYPAGSTSRGEAIRLGRVLATLMPDEPEARGLLALMMIHHARRRARFVRRGPRAARRSGPVSLGRGPDRGGTGGARPGDRPRRARRVRRAGRDRIAADPRADRLAADRRAVPAAGRAHRLPGGRAQPRGGGGPGRRPRRGARAVESVPPATWTATCTSTPPAASCCGGSAAATRPARRTAGRSTWPPRPPSGGS